MPTIYHYTDSAGLIGIIERKKIWATNVWFMNDTGEGTFGWNLVREFIRQKTATSEAEKTLLLMAAETLKDIDNTPSYPDTYIACFSQKGNDLSQWRAYGRGTGFSIGFDSAVLDKMAGSLNEIVTKPALVKVIYKHSRQRDTLQELYQTDILDHILAASETTLLAANFLVNALMAISSMKHEAFSSEYEWRLRFFARKGNSRIMFRNSSMGITPYIEVPWDNTELAIGSAIKEIQVGPQLHPDIAQRAVQNLLARNDIGKVEVKPSTIPLRPN
jgi:Protein of unknown function (DUF2971)